MNYVIIRIVLTLQISWKISERPLSVPRTHDITLDHSRKPCSTWELLHSLWNHILLLWFLDLQNFVWILILRPGPVVFPSCKVHMDFHLIHMLDNGLSTNKNLFWKGIPFLDRTFGKEENQNGKLCFIKYLIDF